MCPFNSTSICFLKMNSSRPIEDWGCLNNWTPKGFSSWMYQILLNHTRIQAKDSMNFAQNACAEHELLKIIKAMEHSSGFSNLSFESLSYPVGPIEQNVVVLHNKTAIGTKSWDWGNGIQSFNTSIGALATCWKNLKFLEWQICQEMVIFWIRASMPVIRIK